LATEGWERFYEFDSTSLKAFPLPKEMPLELTTRLQAEVDAYTSVLPSAICAGAVPTREGLDRARSLSENHLGCIVALQEELDWLCYRLYGILEEDLSAQPDRIPVVKVGERTFEIWMAQRMSSGALRTTWLDRHQSRPTLEIPSHWPEVYRNVCARRQEAIERNREIALIEQPEYKRRWNLPSWEEMERAALEKWLLERLETSEMWNEHSLVSCAQLRDLASRDHPWICVAELFTGGPVEDLSDLVTRLAIAEAVPFLPVFRYTASGLRRRAEWEHVWDLQRRQDAGEYADIPVPRKYKPSDFQKSDYWRLRGGLDVPKERFILYPAFERDADASPVLGWAGWNHLEQARALASYYQRMRQEEGWEPERLKPILAGLLDLKPWLVQWHNEVDPEMGVRLGEYFVQFAEGQCQELGFSPEDVRAWQPATAAPRRGRRRRSQ
jgi:hypothetical protein